MRAIRVLSFLFLFLSVSIAKAQIDTEFWFAAPEVAATHADRPIYLVISTMDQPASVTISQPANVSFTPITLQIGANNTETIDLTPYIDLLENIVPDAAVNKGLFIKSTELITAYYEVLGTAAFGVVNTDIFSLKGQNGLGLKFYTPFQNYFKNNVGYSSFDIVATEDNTTITITPTNDIDGHAAGIPFTINLNKGQTYSARAIGSTGALHLSGSLVTSDKPIAVTIKDDSLLDPNDPTFGWDLAGDQIIPVPLTGMDYVAIKASGTLNIDRIFICATDNATDIFIDGNAVPIATIQQGETYMYQLVGDYTYVQSSKPVYVFHMTGFGKELAGALLPPIKCTGSRQIGFTRPTAEQFALHIVVKAGGEDDFILNGSTTVITADKFSDVPGTGGQWKAANIIFVDEYYIAAGYPSLIKNTSTDFHLGILNGDFVFGVANHGFRYGYFSDYGALELGPDKAICKGDSVTFNGGFGMTSYLWSNGETDQYITVKDSGTYSVKIKKGACVLRDTIDSVHVAFNPTPRKVLGHDTTVCSNTGFEIKMDTLYSSYIWQNGTRTKTFKPTSTGTYWVAYKNHYGCKQKDSIDVVVNMSPHPVINYNTDLEKVCWEATIELDAGPGYAKYRWQGGETFRSITTPHLPEYYVVVTDLNGCTDSTNLYIDCSPYVKVFNLFTPNGDGKNDVFYVEGLKPNKWILEIYNRWGDKIYYNRNYNNDFDGKDVDSGIYFYILRHVEDKNTFKGWVHILKE